MQQTLEYQSKTSGTRLLLFLVANNFSKKKKLYSSILLYFKTILDFDITSLDFEIKCGVLITTDINHQRQIPACVHYYKPNDFKNRD